MTYFLAGVNVGMLLVLAVQIRDLIQTVKALRKELAVLSARV